MIVVHLIVVLALFQFMVFGGLVGGARGRYGVKAPATTGHEIFERYYRVQMNTLELLILLLPTLWIASDYLSTRWIALAGVIYLVGRVVYLRAYIKDPSTRSLGYGLSIFPIIALLIAILIGLGMRYVNGVTV
jgi:glutathione S-transferase